MADTLITDLIEQEWHIVIYFVPGCLPQAQHRSNMRTRGLLSAIKSLGKCQPKAGGWSSHYSFDNSRPVEVGHPSPLVSLVYTDPD